MERKRGDENSGIHQIRKKQSRRSGTAIPHAASSILYTIHCRQELAPAGSQKLRAQDSGPARQCGAEGRTWHQGRERGNGEGSGYGGEDDYGDEHEGRDEGGNGSGSGNGRENGDENREEDGGERGPGNIRSGNRGGSENARRWAMPTSNQQPQSQDPPP